MNAEGQLLSEREFGAEGEVLRTFTYDGPWLASERVEEGDWVSEVERVAIDDRGRTLNQGERWRRGAGAWEYDYGTLTTWTGRSAHIAVMDARGFFTAQIELDSLGNLVKRTAGGLTDEWRYDASGQLAWEKPAGQATTVYQYAEGLLKRSNRTDGTTSEATTYSYFPSGKLKSVVDPSNRTRSFTWTPRGFLASETYGIGVELEQEAYTYDAGGFLATRQVGGAGGPT